MTTRFREIADEITVTAPALPPGFFDRARRTRRVRQAVTACAATLLIVLTGLGLHTTLTAAPLPPAASDPVRVPLPSEIVEVPRWLADVRSAPIGRAQVVLDLVDRLVLVGSGNSFRDLPMNEPLHRYWLSPDGTRLAIEDDQSYLLDLASGERHDLPGLPVTWSSDGAQLAVAQEGGFAVLEAATLAVAWSVPKPVSANCPEVQGVFSPDASRFAVVCVRALDIYERSGQIVASHSLPGQFRFAGDRAWSPHSPEIMFKQNESNHVMYVDIQTGVHRNEDLYQRWRSSAPLTPNIVDWWQGSPVFSNWTSIVTTPADTAQRPQYTLRRADGRTLQAATAIVDWSQTRPPPKPDAGPWLLRLHYLWDDKARLACIVLPLALILVFAASVITARRRVTRLGHLALPG